MNTFNRVVLVFLCLVIMFGAAAVTALAWAGPDESIDWLRDAAAWLDDHNTDGTKFLITVGAVTISAMALTVLVIELYPRRAGHVKVTDLQAGDAVLSTAAIGQRVEQAVNALDSVTDARATVRAKRKGVSVELDIHVDPDADLATVTDAASEAARNVLTEKVHVALVGPPHTRIHYRELRLQNRPPRRPTASTAPTPSEADTEEQQTDEEAAVKA